MSHECMTHGSKAADTLPAIISFADKVRPAAILSEACPFMTAPHHSPHAGAMIRKALEARGEGDKYSVRTHIQRFTTVTLYHGPRAV